MIAASICPLLCSHHNKKKCSISSQNLWSDDHGNETKENFKEEKYKKLQQCAPSRFTDKKMKEEDRQRCRCAVFVSSFDRFVLSVLRLLWLKLLGHCACVCIGAMRAENSYFKVNLFRMKSLEHTHAPKVSN